MTTPQHKDTTLDEILSGLAEAIAEGVVTGDWSQTKARQTLLQWRDKAVAEARLDERELLERLDLEFEAIRCDDCGRPWTPSDPHDIVIKRLAQLKETPNED